MIRTDAEYHKTLEQIAQVQRALEAQRQQFTAAGLDAESLQLALDPSEAMLVQLQDEAATYRRMQRGELGTLTSVADIGRWLIGVRLARRMTQKQLAEALGVSEAQVSRDERNEYHGISVERAQSLLARMGVHYRIEEVLNGGEVRPVVLPETPQDMPPPSLPAQVGAYLRADRKLSPDKAAQLADMFARLYASYAEESPTEGDQRAVDAHR